MKSFSLVFFLTAAVTVFSQRNFTLHQHQNIQQSMHLNPAFRPNVRFYISAASGLHSFGLNHSGFTWNDLAVKRELDDSLELRPSSAIEQMAELNHIDYDMVNELFGLGLRLNKMHFSFTVSNRTQLAFNYTRDLFKFVFEGNGASLLGQRANLDGLGIRFNSYLEYAIGANRSFLGDKLVVGGRFKLISGIANVHTARSQLGIYTDSTTFDITLDGALTLNTSGFGGFAASDLTNLGFTYLTQFPNFGVGLDLGASYNISDKINVSASVVDLGFINWKTNNQNLVTNDVNFKFEGVDINQFLQDTNFVSNFTDSLQGIFDASQDSSFYRTALSTRFYLGGTFEVLPVLHINALWFNEFILGRYRPGFALGATFRLGEIVSASANYSIYGRANRNIGLGINFRLGPLQLFAMTDNILGVLDLSTSKNWHANAGLAFMIGKPDKKKKKDEE